MEPEFRLDELEESLDCNPRSGILLSINDTNVFWASLGLPYNLDVGWRISSCNDATESMGKYTSATVIR